MPARMSKAVTSASLGRHKRPSGKHASCLKRLPKACSVCEKKEWDASAPVSSGDGSPAYSRHGGPVPPPLRRGGFMVEGAW